MINLKTLLEATELMKMYSELNMPSSDDFKRAEFICTNINKRYRIPKLKKEPLDTAIKEAYNCLKVFNSEDILKELCLLDPCVPVFYGDNEEDCFVSYDKINDKEFIVSSYTFPYDSTEITKIAIAHEKIHALKDTNYKELQNNLITSEVIPLFFELLTSEYESNDFVKKVISFRMKSIRYAANTYRDAKFQIVNHLAFYKAYQEGIKYIMINSQRYLNGLYLALLIHSAYLCDNKLVLKEVLKVLSREINTMDLLRNLGVLDQDNPDFIVKNELNRIHKLTH